MKRPVVAKEGERGFALLIVFLLAAAIALMLYQQMPRVAFESERDKEDLLIDRGEQYKRAIQLYLVVNKRYPARIEDLENTNDKRFLRKRYIDPFTGKNEWRLVHTNGMFLTDSLVQKPPTATPGDDKSKGTSASNTTTGATGTSGTSGTGAPGTGAPPDVNATVYQRPSDRTLPTGLPGQFNPAQPTDPTQVGIGPGQTAFPPITLAPLPGTGQQGANGQPGGPPIGQPGVLPPGIVPTTMPGTVQPGLPGGFPPGTSQFPVQGTDPTQQPGQFPGQPGQGPGAIPGLPVSGNLQGGSAGGQNSAISLINQLLTQPRTPPAGIGVSQTNNTVGGGIAGVASTYEGPSIKSYNTRTKFNEWEFVFQNQQQAVPGQTTPQPNGQQTGQAGNSSTGNAPPPTP